MTPQTTIEIKGEKYLIRQSFRALKDFETMTGKNAFEINASINDSLVIFYCTVAACNRDKFHASFEEFIDMVDESETAFAEFSRFMESLLEPETAVADKKKVETR